MILYRSKSDWRSWLEQQIDAEQIYRVARKKAQEVQERQDRRASQGERANKKAVLPESLWIPVAIWLRIVLQKLKVKHSGIIDDTQQRLSALQTTKTVQN